MTKAQLMPINRVGRGRTGQCAQSETSVKFRKELRIDRTIGELVLVLKLADTWNERMRTNGSAKGNMAASS